MTEKSDIIDGRSATGKKSGLIYTEKCGWVDLGHANPAGALELWQKILKEKDDDYYIKYIEKPDYFRISYHQKMTKKSFGIGTAKKYDIKKGLDSDQKNRLHYQYC